MKLPDPPLLVITDQRLACRPLEEIAAAAFAGGCRWLSLREKDLAPAERLGLLTRLVLLGRRWGAVVGVHDDVPAALAAGAAAVHLPDGASPWLARAQLGPSVLIGLSVHDGGAIARAAAEGADYVTLSPVFASASKPGYGPELGLAALSAAAGQARLPVIALGGIGAAAVADCLAAGAGGVAVMGAVMAAEDPAAATAALIAGIAARP